MKKNEIIKNDWLITIDLDGTTIGEKSNDGSKYEIPEINIKAIKELKKLGHHIAIVTGRAWRLTKEIYELLEIDTIVVNHNGAYIHKPKDFSFMGIKTGMNNKLVSEILNDPYIRKVSLNILMEFKKETLIYDENDNIFLHQFHIKSSELQSEIKKFKYGDLILHDPFSVAIKINYKDFDSKDILIYLRRKYGNAFAFRYWENDEVNQMFLEINSLNANKGNALKVIASYYNTPISNTIAFGDGLNDIQMIQEANFGIAMKNAVDVLKEIAKDITDKTNVEGGVGHYLKDFFDLDI